MKRIVFVNSLKLSSSSECSGIMGSVITWPRPGQPRSYITLALPSSHYFTKPSSRPFLLSSQQNKNQNRSSVIKIPSNQQYVQKIRLIHGIPAKSSELVHGEEDLFGDYRIAYGTKSTWELLRTLSVFFLCKFSFFTDNAVRLMDMSYRILGRRFSDFLIERTVYSQFVAGRSEKELIDVIIKLRQVGVGPMLCIPIECDPDGPPVPEEFFDTSLKKVLSSLSLALTLNDAVPMFQYRFSALMPGDLLKAMSKCCTGTSPNTEVLNALVEGMKGKNIAFSKLPVWSEFPDEKSEQLARGLRRLGAICEAMKPHDVVGLIDAEYTYLNPALRVLALSMMKYCNTERAKVFYTYQAYLKATPAILENDISYAKENGFCFGLKLVRGAYMVKERQLARTYRYEDPVNESFEQTTNSYHRCLDLLFKRVLQGPQLSCRFIIASHNEDTVRYALQRMEELQIPKDGVSVLFGQLYGMADHVSYTLGHNGYRIFKSIPYGSIADTLPYLARRAQENKAILANARRERALVGKTLKSRIFSS
ncbi:hydroxyproline dehydrogenase-like [Physella acuta]|uniref:hydroxyproline dehydrogenase-like n=1 Tax=Physella acuta TaxID=109671 RepID=UPI0027DDD6DB|nr:hydroxyproline dehydrogenase-like [Physella acuta]